MRYLALATDYDGTLVASDRVSESVAQALHRLRISGRRTILVTGRPLDDLLSIRLRSARCWLQRTHSTVLLFMTSSGISVWRRR